jgi:hypothetical protein
MIRFLIMLAALIAAALIGLVVAPQPPKRHVTTEGFTRDHDLAGAPTPRKPALRNPCASLEIYLGREKLAAPSGQGTAESIKRCRLAVRL